MIKKWSAPRKQKAGLKKLIIGGIIAAGVFIVFDNGRKYFDMKYQRDSLKAEIEDLEKQNKQLNKKIKNLYNDKEFVEKVAREQLNLVKKGETVYIIAEE